MNQQPPSSNRLQYISVFLFAILMLLIWMQQFDPQSLRVGEGGGKSANVQPGNSKTHGFKVTTHLRTIENRMQLQKHKARIENEKAGPAPSVYSKPVEPPDILHGVKIERENPNDLLDDIGRNEYTNIETSTPADEIYRDLANQVSEEQESMFDQLNISEKQKNYLRGVVHRARKDGYELVINTQLEVVGYRKIDPLTGKVSKRITYLDGQEHGR